jgi:hypothetical protein
MSQTPGGIKKIKHANPSITKMKESLDDTNWVVWRERIRRIFRLCNVEPYVYGQLMRPDLATTDPDICDLWDTNDVYAQILITNNISKDQIVRGPKARQTISVMYNPRTDGNDQGGDPISPPCLYILHRWSYLLI